jgi:DNA-binding NtrC family response regulator
MRTMHDATCTMRLLITWSDRSTLEGTRSHRSRRPKADRGPVLRLLEQRESRGAYDAAWVLTTPEHEAPTRDLVAAVRRYVADTTLRTLDLDDPSDHEKLFHALLPVVRDVPEDAEVTVVLSAGTPQAQTLWVVLVKSGLLPARMVQVIPPAFVPRPHPRALREVTLDIAGFPEIRALREELVQLRAREEARAGLVGQSPVMEALVQRLGRVAAADVPVLVQGETGTGKDLVARAIHRASARRDGPFLAENCGALAEGTLESELFGHEKGAFTGAIARRKGLFELAHGGTLFLDEVAEAGPAVQVRLLRALEQGVIRRVGGETEVRVDVRIIAATHRDLTTMLRDGRFREDLYYRLNGARLEVPPLRERLGDLEPLVLHFLDAQGRHPMPTRRAWRALERYPFPGNVRELRAEVARWVVFCEDRVELDDLSPEIRAAAASADTEDEPRPAAPSKPSGAPASLVEEVRALERSLVDAALVRNEGNLSRTARELGIDRNTLKRKLRSRVVDTKAKTKAPAQARKRAAR